MNVAALGNKLKIRVYYVTGHVGYPGVSTHLTILRGCLYRQRDLLACMTKEDVLVCHRLYYIRANCILKRSHCVGHYYRYNVLSCGYIILCSPPYTDGKFQITHTCSIR